MSGIEAAMGAVFQALIEEVRKAVVKGWIFKKKLAKIKKKLEALGPLIDEMTRLNVGLDMSRYNKHFLEVMEEGKNLVVEMSRDGERKFLWKYLRNTTKIGWLESELADLMQILQAQTAIVAMRILRVVTNMPGSPAFAVGQGQQPSLAPAGSGGACDALDPPQFTVGLDEPLEGLKMEISKQDRRVIVLTAPPGSGKTTLLQKLCKDEKIEERYGGNILYVKVSKTPNLKVIVEVIHEHYRRKVPLIQDAEDARNCLGRLLKEMGKSSPILLVLDDVWSDSEWLINKLNFEFIPEYKILVASRFEFPNFKPAYELKMLSDEDAMALFLYHAKLEDMNNNLKALVEEVVQHCKRNPLALELVGRALGSEPVIMWRKELDKWSERVSSILDFEEDLLLRLQSSVDLLGEKDANLKECFIDLGSFPEDRRIPASALIDIWTELYGIKEEDAAINLLRLNKMKMANIVVTRSDVDEDDDYYSEHFVTLHDMIRVLAIHQSKQNSGQVRRLIMELLGNNLADSSNALDTQSLNARLVSISTNGLFSSEPCNVQLTETEVLVLNFLKEDQALPEFVQRMSQLKVLIVTNYGSFPAELSNFQLLGFLTSLKKIRLERVTIPSFTSIKMDNLQKLSFFMCKVGHAFSSVDMSEAFPNLEEMNVDYCSDLVELPTAICAMVKMKKLSVTHCHKLSSLPKEIGKMGNLEVLRLRSCIDLTDLPGSICELSKLKFLDISNCFSIRFLPDDIGKLSSLTKLNMKECSRLKDLPSSALDFEKLVEVVCDEEMKELWELFLPCDSNIELTLAKEDNNLNFL